MQNRVDCGGAPVEIDNYLPFSAGTRAGKGGGGADPIDPAGGGSGPATPAITISIPITINPVCPTQTQPPGNGNGQNIGTQFFERQIKSQWCWAAVALAIDHYFSPNSTWTQCAIAQQVLHPAQCWCDHPFTNETCDKAAYLQAALTAVQRPFTPIQGASPFATVRSEIDSARPVCVRIQWPGGGGHFVIISGYRVLKSQVRQLVILDPLFGPSLQDDDAFRRSYRLSGQWTDTFLMQ